MVTQTRSVVEEARQLHERRVRAGEEHRHAEEDAVRATRIRTVAIQDRQTPIPRPFAVLDEALAELAARDAQIGVIGVERPDEVVVLAEHERGVPRAHEGLGVGGSDPLR